MYAHMLLRFAVEQDDAARRLAAVSLESLSGT